MLPENEFLDVIKLTPLVAIDLLVWNPSKQVLVGSRLNRPAKGYWFVPGGRIYKDERFADAFRRISVSELSIKLEINSAEFAGFYEHFYGDNFAGAKGITTHYVVLAFQILLTEGPVNLPLYQHRSYKWMNVEEIIESGAVHPNTKNYFINPNPVVKLQMSS